MTLLVLGLVALDGRPPLQARRAGRARRARRVARRRARRGAWWRALIVARPGADRSSATAGAPSSPVYDPPSWGIHLNNLLMLGRRRRCSAPATRRAACAAWLRHPMLTGVVVWAVAHLLVNGDVASLVLFGWMGLWALAEHRC